MFVIPSASSEPALSEVEGTASEVRPKNLGLISTLTSHSRAGHFYNVISTEVERSIKTAISDFWLILFFLFNFFTFSLLNKPTESIITISGQNSFEAAAS
jgi:hypothetical protein